jgi:hypothetical protein
MSTKIEFRAGAIGSLIGSFAFGSDPRAYFGRAYLWRCPLLAAQLRVPRRIEGRAHRRSKLRSRFLCR